MLFAVLAGFAFSLQLNVSVTDKDQTKLYGTLVEILKGDEVIASKTAERVQTMRTLEHAMAQFELEPGMYFIRLSRASYPGEVAPVVITTSIQKNLVMLLNKPTYTIYGQIIDEPEGRWANSKLIVIDEKSANVSQSSVYEKGYFAVERLDPAKTYRLRLGDGENRKISAPFRYSVEGIYYLEIDLRTSDVLVDASAKMTVSPYASKGQVISVYLRAGEKELAGEIVDVQTPKGKIEAISNENGVAQVGAGDYGEYVFEWRGQRAVVLVEAPQVEEEEEYEPVQEETEIQEPNSQNGSGDALIFGMGIAGIFIIAVVIAGLLVVGAIAYYLQSSKKEESKFETKHKKGKAKE